MFSALKQPIPGENNIALHYAARDGKEQIMELSLKKKIDVNVENSLGITPLHLSLVEGREGIASNLIDRGADVSLLIPNQLECGIPGSQNAPLHVAARYRKIALIEQMLEKEVDVDVKNSLGITPLHLAVVYGREGIASCLIDKGADVTLPIPDELDCKIPGTHNTTLHVAADRRMMSLVRQILEKEIDINVENSFGITPLHLAIVYDRKGIASSLISQGADVTVPIPEQLDCGIPGVQNTLLHVAAHRGMVSVVEQMFDKEIEINVKNSLNITPLHLAVVKGREGIANSLIERGADVTIPIPDELNCGLPYTKNSLLHVAADRGMVSLVKKMLEKEINIDIENGQGLTALHLTVIYDRKGVANCLIDKGADVTLPIPDQHDCGIPGTQNTILHIAANRGMVSLVRQLLEKEIDINIKNSLGITPFHLAFANQYDYMMNFLISRGADLSLPFPKELEKREKKEEKKEEKPIKEKEAAPTQ